jgi:hypothetical protein
MHNIWRAGRISRRVADWHATVFGTLCRDPPAAAER